MSKYDILTYESLMTVFESSIIELCELIKRDEPVQRVRHLLEQVSESRGQQGVLFLLNNGVYDTYFLPALHTASRKHHVRDDTAPKRNCGFPCGCYRNHNDQCVQCGQNPVLTENHKQVVQYLIQMGADKTLRDSYTELTPYEHATQDCLLTSSPDPELAELVR